MKFKIDENLPVEAAELLRQAGHDAITVPEQHPGAVPIPMSRWSASKRGAFW